MTPTTIATTEISSDLLDAVRSFPATREVEHCGVRFSVSSLAIYGTCPHCAARIKLRAFSAYPDLADLFDGFLEWMNHPENSRVAAVRMREIEEDE